MISHIIKIKDTLQNYLKVLVKRILWNVPYNGIIKIVQTSRFNNLYTIFH